MAKSTSNNLWCNPGSFSLQERSPNKVPMVSIVYPALQLPFQQKRSRKASNRFLLAGQENAMRVRYWEPTVCGVARAENCVPQSFHLCLTSAQRLTSL